MLTYVHGTNAAAFPRGTTSNSTYFLLPANIWLNINATPNIVFFFFPSSYNDGGCLEIHGPKIDRIENGPRKLAQHVNYVMGLK